VNVRRAAAQHVGGLVRENEWIDAVPPMDRSEEIA